MTALERPDLLTETAPEAVPVIVSILIDNAVAALDADRGTSRTYLLRASAILQGFSTRERTRCPNRRSRSGLARWQLNRVIDYIEQHIAERITGEDLAHLIGVSIGQLFRAFKVSVGVPPLHYVAVRRLELARSLLRTSREPLSQIALTAGFCDQSHLCRVFRRLIGVTPAAWRRENAPDPEVDPRNRRKPITPTVGLCAERGIPKSRLSHNSLDERPCRLEMYHRPTNA